MALSFTYLLEIVESKTLFLDLDQERKNGGFRWKGPHFSVFLRYALNLRSYRTHERFRDLLTRVEESAYLCCKTKDFSRLQFNLVKFLEAMASFLTELGEFFAVPKPQQLLSGTISKRNELVAAFIDFLVEAVEAFLGQRFFLESTTNHMYRLLRHLKFLLFILGDTPFRYTQVEETNNILAEIESIANEAGLFLHSSCFTTDLVEDHKIAAAISDLLPKFEMRQEMIMKYCIISNLSRVTTPNTTLVSIFIVDYVLDYLDRLINNKAPLITELKDQITTFHEELHLSRSFLGDIEVKQDEDSIKQALQLTDLAYDAEYILTWFVTGEVPVWYISLRLFNFIEKKIRTSIPETKLNYGINNLQVVQSPHQVWPQVSNNTQTDEEIIVGLNDETIQIASQFVGGPDQLQMI